ncbi:MAG: hypothetical protein HQL97_00665 [Magnetococcales bacterium]|nr:hypothetical protein [Magnetococcales bacterium]
MRPGQQGDHRHAGLFDGTAGAVACLSFVLLHFPWVAATAAIQQEVGLLWTLFAALWTTVVAWSVATGFYPAATIANHPGPSFVWLAGSPAGLFLRVDSMIRQFRASDCDNLLIRLSNRKRAS